MISYSVSFLHHVWPAVNLIFAKWVVCVWEGLGRVGGLLMTAFMTKLQQRKNVQYILRKCLPYVFSVIWCKTVIRIKAW